MNRQGFTLVELLVTMGIVGILLTVVLNLQSSTISFTEQQGSTTQRLQAINDVSGYIGDRVKAASSVPDGLALSDGLTTAGTSTCSRSGSAPCLAVILPVVDSTCGLIINWRLHAFRYIARTSISATEKLPSPGLEVSGVYGLKEIRVPSGQSDGSCTSPMATVPTSFAGTVSSGMVADNLVLPTGTAKAFDYDTSTRTITLRLRSVTSSRSGTPTYTPTSSSYELKIFARNVN